MSEVTGNTQGKNTMMSYRKGVTLIELLVVIGILAALAVIAIPKIGGLAHDVKEQGCATNIDTMESQIELWISMHDGAYPDSLTDITADADYFPDGPPQCPLGGTYTLDKNIYRVNCSH